MSTERSSRANGSGSRPRPLSRAEFETRIRDEYETTDAEDDRPKSVRAKGVRIDPILEEAFTEAASDDADWGATPQGYATSRRIQLSLRELGRTGSSAPLGRLGVLLFRHPHLTKQVSYYLRTRINGGWEADTVRLVSEALAADAFPYPWQRGWLLHALIPAKKKPLPPAAIDVSLAAFHADDLSFVRGRAAIVLATQGLLPVGPELAHAFDDVAKSNRADLVGAASLMPETTARDRFLESVRRDRLLRAIAEASAETSAIYL